MKKMTWIMAGLLMAPVLGLGLGMAADVDGKWTAEIVARSKKDAETKTVTTFNFKTSGDGLTGTVTAGARQKNALEIIDGKVAGGKVSFKTKATTKKGEQIIVWEGKVDGDTLQGTRGREGAKRTTEFTAKRVP